MKLTKNTVDPDARSQFSWSSGCLRKNVVNFGTDNSSSIHFNNKKKIF